MTKVAAPEAAKYGMSQEEHLMIPISQNSISHTQNAGFINQPVQEPAGDRTEPVVGVYGSRDSSVDSVSISARTSRSLAGMAPLVSGPEITLFPESAKFSPQDLGLIYNAHKTLHRFLGQTTCPQERKSVTEDFLDLFKEKFINFLLTDQEGFVIYIVKLFAKNRLDLDQINKFLKAKDEDKENHEKNCILLYRMLQTAVTTYDHDRDHGEVFVNILSGLNSSAGGRSLSVNLANEFLTMVAEKNTIH